MKEMIESSIKMKIWKIIWHLWKQSKRMEVKKVKKAQVREVHEGNFPVLFLNFGRIAISQSKKEINTDLENCFYKNFRIILLIFQNI
jgi:hypothetical protein